MSEWQPIETAPNDEGILVAYDSGIISLVDADDNDFCWRPYDGIRTPGREAPTHWMPLPDPPQLDDAE